MAIHINKYAALINQIDEFRHGLLIRRIDIAKQAEVVRRIEAIEQALGGNIHPTNQALLSNAKNFQNPIKIMANVNAAVVKELSMGKASDIKTACNLCVDLEFFLRI